MPPPAGCNALLVELPRTWAHDPANRVWENTRRYDDTPSSKADDTLGRQRSLGCDRGEPRLPRGRASIADLRRMGSALVSLRGGPLCRDRAPHDAGDHGGAGG